MAKTTIWDRYAMFQDIHVMIYVGFGFLMVFLKTNQWTSVGFSYLIAAWCYQIALLLIPFWDMWFNAEYFTKINFTLESLIKADFAAAAVLISFSALVGKMKFIQLFVFGTLEVVFYSLNLAITYGTFKHSDVGGGITIMVFGAFFGIFATWWFTPKKAIANERGGRGSYSSQTVAMVGTLFLFMYWPSFNAALVNGVA